MRSRCAAGTFLLFPLYPLLLLFMGSGVCIISLATAMGTWAHWVQSPAGSPCQAACAPRVQDASSSASALDPAAMHDATGHEPTHHGSALANNVQRGHQPLPRWNELWRRMMHTSLGSILRPACMWRSFLRADAGSSHIISVVAVSLYTLIIEDLPASARIVVMASNRAERKPTWLTISFRSERAADTPVTASPARPIR